MPGRRTRRATKPNRTLVHRPSDRVLGIPPPEAGRARALSRSPRTHALRATTTHAH